jgi:hypothetical protein
MSAVTHATTTDGRLHLDLIDMLRPIQQQFAWALGRLDGRKHFAYSLWKLPDGQHADDPIDYNKWPEAYIQVAGTAKAMTVDVRMLDEGKWANFTVGRPAVKRRFGRQKTAVVRWLEHSIVLRENEVFDASGAAIVFHHYFEHGIPPVGYELRSVDA